MIRIGMILIAILCMSASGCEVKVAEASNEADAKVPEKVRTDVSKNVREMDGLIEVTPFRYGDIEYLHVVDWGDDAGIVMENKSYYCKKDTIVLGGRTYIAITEPPYNILENGERVPTLE